MTFATAMIARWGPASAGVDARPDADLCWPDLRPDRESGHWPALLARIAEHTTERPLLLLAAEVQLAPDGIERLRNAAGHLRGHPVLLSTLDLCDAELSPLPPGLELARSDETLAAADRICAWLGHGDVFHWHRPLLHAALWLPGGAASLIEADWHPGRPLPIDRPCLVTSAVVSADPGRPWSGPPHWPLNDVPPPVRPADRLRDRWPAKLDAGTPHPAGRPPGSDTAVVLHICHSWGGGSARFIRDLAAADDQRCHLLLSAHGSTPRQQFGEWLELRQAAEPGLALERHPLSPVIADTSAGHPLYAQLLAGIIQRWQVDAVLVSSLIGHDLAALETGLPTAVVCHDYYPLWPELHCDFGDRNRRFDRDELVRDLARAPLTLFDGHDPEHWWSLRERLVACLQRQQPVLVAPTGQVRDNWQRIEPRLARLDWRVLGHGLAPWPAPPAPNTPPAKRPSLRVLVPGRIAGGKGLSLLLPLQQQLPPDCELILLGAGQEGEAMLGRSGVHVVFDYPREHLPALLAELRPDLALLPATVSETFGYLLSELLSLGLPVLATAIGSYPERIVDGENGLLVAPDPAAIADRLAALQRDRSVLARIRAHLAATPVHSSADMAADYRDLLPVPQPRSGRSELAPLGPERMIQADLARQLWENKYHLGRMIAQAAEQRAELARRADWGFALNRELAERNARVATLQDEIETKVRHIEHLHEEIETERRLSAEEMQRIFSSRSWRVMAPARFLARKLRGARARLQFQMRRIGNLGHRLRLSVATRGLAGTIAHLRRRGRGLAAGPAGVPAVPTPTATVPPAQLPTSQTPLVSIIVPIHGKLAYTCACLASLAEHGADGPAFEILVVDDASPDDSAEVLAGVEGLRLLRNERNLGFVGSCNAGAATARGRWLVFLNNDTTVTAGWLAALLDTHRDFDQVGLVGARLVYPDGRLQEAGGLVFNDGSGWNYGRFDDPADPRYGYARECDYCSGAAILIERELFQRLGGFDERYAPAYYEDTDLAFKVREVGLKVLCQPGATVIHHEGITSGTDTGSGIKRHQVINQVTFQQRWTQALSRQPAPGTAVDDLVRRAPNGHILVIDATTPQPDQDSGSVRLTHILRLLRESGRHVTFFADNRAYVAGYSEALQRMGIEVLYHPWLADPVDWLRRNGPTLDAVLVCRHYIAANYLDLVRQFAPRARFLFDTVDLHYLREERAAALAGSDEIARQAARTRAQEQRLIRASDVTLVVSPVERELLQRALPGCRVEVLSNVHPVHGCRQPWAQRHDLFFVGGFQHPPNIDAVVWFCTEVFPLVRRALPEVRFHVIGSRITAQIQALACDGIEIHGHVADLEPYLDGCRIALAPLRYGAGVKGKVNMSMSYGQPVVATPMAVEGMHLEPEREVLVADSPAAFAAAVVRLYQDEALWNRLSAAGLDNVRRHFSFEAARTALDRILRNTTSGM